jgi:hypothetical protein
MIDHIYGRDSILRKKYRPHMFINELRIYSDYLKEHLKNANPEDAATVKYCRQFCKNMHDALAYYKNISGAIFKSSSASRTQFITELQEIETEINSMASRM